MKVLVHGHTAFQQQNRYMTPGLGTLSACLLEGQRRQNKHSGALPTPVVPDTVLCAQGSEPPNGRQFLLRAPE